VYLAVASHAELVLVDGSVGPSSDVHATIPTVIVVEIRVINLAAKPLLAEHQWARS
jgi:hypothetical protein